MEVLATGEAYIVIFGEAAELGQDLGVGAGKARGVETVGVLGGAGELGIEAAQGLGGDFGGFTGDLLAGYGFGIVAARLLPQNGKLDDEVDV